MVLDHASPSESKLLFFNSNVHFNIIGKEQNSKVKVESSLHQARGVTNKRELTIYPLARLNEYSRRGIFRTSLIRKSVCNIVPQGQIGIRERAILSQSVQIIARFSNSQSNHRPTMSKEPNELPSYEEVTKLTYQDDRSSGQRLINQLTAVRAEHTRRIADEHICPSIRKRAEDGLSKTTVVLIPSNLDVSKTSDAIEIVDFHDHEEEVEQVQLEGSLNRLEFWRQPDVIKELCYALEERLSASPILRDFGQRATQVEEPTTASISIQKRRGFLGRSSGKQTHDITPKPESASPSQIPSSRIDVKVALEDICMRTVSNFGLYETATQPVVVVQVDVNA